MAKKQNYNWLWWIVAAVVVLSITGIGNQYFMGSMESLADVDGQPCTNNTIEEDCGQCWDQNSVGAMECTDGQCDTTFCVSYEPVGDWLIEHPWQWIKSENGLLYIIGGVAILIFGQYAFSSRRR